MIEMKELSFNYRRNKTVFKGLDMQLQRGHIYGLLGKNGSGKSTLLKLLTGLLFPDRGEIKVMGYTPGERCPSFLSELFFIPEEFYLPDMNMKVYARLLAPFYPRFDEGLLEECMHEFDVSAEEKLGRMSYGQKKKALIGLALACNTELLVMDEPTNGLDIPSKGIFRKLISSVADEKRCIAISTHQVRDLESLIDAIMILEESRMLINATTERITERILFKPVEEGDEVLFEEVSLKGRWGCVLNTNHRDSRLDMELFFNAVLKDPERISEILN